MTDPNNLGTNTPKIGNTSILEILDIAGLFYSVKNKNLEYLKVSSKFCEVFDLEDGFVTDFDVFIPEIAFELNHEDSLTVTSAQPSEKDRILIGKNGREMVVNVSRSVVDSDGDSLLVTIYKDITEKTQAKQFEAYKHLLTESEIFEKILNRFTSIIFNSNDRREIFEGVGNLIIDVLKLEDISIFLVDEKNQVLNQILVIEKGQKIKYSEEGDLYKSFSLSKGITGKAARQKESIILDNVSLDPDYVSDSIKARSEIAVPIIYKNKVLGVLDSESTHLAHYDDRIKRLLEGVASLLAIKINELKNFRKLQARNVELNSLIRSNPTSIAMLDTNANYIDVSQKWLNQFVVEGKNIIGLNHFKENPNLPIRWRKKIEKALAGEPQSIFEESIRRKNGKVEFFTATINPWYTEENKIGGVILIADNVTEQKEKEVKLLQSSVELKEAKKMGKLFSWEVDLTKGVFQWETNDRASTSNDADAGLSLDVVFENIDEEYHADFNLAIENALKDNSTFSIIHPYTIDGTKYWFHNRGRVEFDGDDTHKVLGTAQDITDQIDAEQAYKKQNIELKKTNRELDQFVYKTAHDLRAPLTNLIGLIGLMRAEDNKELLNSYFDLQEKSIEKLDKFIKQITTHTKNARLEVLAQEINIKSLINDVLKEHYFVENSDKISKIVNVPKDFIFTSDLERLRGILNNLISNAIKFCDLKKDNPNIEITVSAINSKIHICVKDNGVGIATDQKAKVFDMFHRAHKSADGSGLGLYIVKESLNRLNGQVILNSNEGEFTQIDLFLPDLSQ